MKIEENRGKLYATVASIGLATLLSVKSADKLPFPTPGQAIMSSIEYSKPSNELDSLSQIYATLEGDRLNKNKETKVLQNIDSYKSIWFFEKVLDAKYIKKFLDSENINTKGMNRLNSNKYLDSLVSKVKKETTKKKVIEDYFGEKESEAKEYASKVDNLGEQEIKYLANSKNDFSNRKKTVETYLNQDIKFDNIYKYIDYRILRTLGYSQNAALKIQQNGFEQFTINHEIERRINNVLNKVNVVDIAKSFNKDPNFIMAVIGAESYFNPNARSYVNARGYMQLTGSTAKFLRVNRYKPEENVVGGTKYLRYIANKYEDFPKDVRRKLELVGYNWGPANINKLLTQWRLPKETKNYIVKVHQYYETINESNLLN